MLTHLLFISGSEIFIILLVVLLLFGSKKIPDVAKGLGKGIREFRRATDEIKKEISDNEISKDFKEIKKEITDNRITKDIKEIKDNVKGQGL